MELIRRDELPEVQLVGRVLQNAVGKEGSARIASTAMTVGFATYSERSGEMQPHRHAEESIYIVDAKDAYVLHGDAEDRLGDRRELETGMIMHFPENEWHVFRYEKGGHLDILFVYGSVDNLRPEKVTVK